MVGAEVFLVDVSLCVHKKGMALSNPNIAKGSSQNISRTWKRKKKGDKTSELGSIDLNLHKRKASDHVEEEESNSRKRMSTNNLVDTMDFVGPTAKTAYQSRRQL
ncbi:hypothetical protein ACH5RR_002866 [Cinchona calisaya]|uniref:Uncharacterized protein n=1 Tax=Cinchona calisaya TaxID=153742 RepID=A0ABD3AT71_9GENT